VTERGSRSPVSHTDDDRAAVIPAVATSVDDPAAGDDAAGDDTAVDHAAGDHAVDHGADDDAAGDHAIDDGAGHPAGDDQQPIRGCALLWRVTPIAVRQADRRQGVCAVSADRASAACGPSAVMTCSSAIR